MTRILSYTEEAIDDLAAVYGWLKQRGAGSAAARRMDRITSAIDRLWLNPCLYPFGRHSGVREMSVEGHRVLYEVAPDTGRDSDAGDVLILAIFGPGQNRGGFLP